MAQIHIHDVSFVGSTVSISTPFGDTVITDFMDDANPIEFQDVEVSTVGVNCNGCMVRNAKPNAIMASVTVIPGSENDKTLYNIWRRYRVQGTYEAGWEQGCSLTVTTRVRTDKYTLGTMVSGPAGMSSNAEGKMQGRTYTFAFCKA